MGRLQPACFLPREQTMDRIMLVDDEPHVLSSLRRLLVRSLPNENIHIELCTDPLQALDLARREIYKVVVSDYRMPMMDGVKFLSSWRDIQPNSVRLILSASTDFDAIQAAMNHAEIFRYLVKPWSDEALLVAVGEALARHDQSMETKRIVAEYQKGSGQLSPQEIELQKLEASEPGITKVRWDTDGSIIIDDI